MAQNNWYNNNLFRDYPFIKNSTGFPVSGPMSIINLPTETIVDAGFIFTARSEFNYATDRVYLNRVSRVNTDFIFEFRTNSAKVFPYPLIFTRPVNALRYSIEYADANNYQYDPSDPDCDEPLWYGFLVTGDLEPLQQLLPSDGDILNNNTSSEGIIEPALIQNMNDLYVTSLNIANADRTRATSPSGCPDIVWPFPIGEIYPVKTCIDGDIVLIPGYNTNIRLNEINNVITISGSPGAGMGEPCEEIPVFPGEDTLLSNFPSLSGSEKCNTVLRSINGISVRFFSISAGNGVIVEDKPLVNKVEIKVNMHDSSACYDG